MKLGALLAALALSSSFAPDARADANAEARFYFERGNEELARAMRAHGPARTRLVQEAVNDYLQSLRIVRSKNTVYNLAICYEEIGPPEDAFTYFAEYLSSDINDAERAEASRHLDLVRPRVALVEISSVPPGATVRVDRRDLAPRGATPLTIAVPAGPHHLFLELAGHGPSEADVVATVGQTVRVGTTLAVLRASLAIDVAGAAAEILIDGRPAGRTPLRVQIDPGAHEVRLRRPGSEEVRERLTLAAGEERTLRLPMNRLPSPGGIAVRSNVVAAEVTVDGVSWGAASSSPRGVVPGRHMVGVSAAGHRSASIMVEVGEGQRVEVRATLAQIDPPTRHGGWPVTTGIGAGVSLLVGGIIGVTALQKQDDLGDIERDLGASPDAASLAQARDDATNIADEIDSLNLAADVFYAGAAVLGALTVVLLTTGGERGPMESSLTVAGSSVSIAEVR